MKKLSPSFRSYRSALLSYVLNNGESGLAHAYELGRDCLNAGHFLHLVHIHIHAVNEILASASGGEEIRRRLKASTEFLMEALSPFEMAFRGYVALRKPSAHKRT